MPDPVEPLVLDLLEWLAGRQRLYSDVMEAWRTSCPRLPVWEEANARGFIDRQHQQGSEARVSVSAAGLAFLETHRTTGTHSSARDSERENPAGHFRA